MCNTLLCILSLLYKKSGVTYEFTEISLYGSNGKPKWFRKLNPAGTVPVLTCKHGQVVLPDSDLILDYIADGSIADNDDDDSGSTSSTIIGSLLVTKSPGDSTTEINSNVQKWRNLISRKLIPIGKRAVLGGGKSAQDELFQLLTFMNDEVVEGTTYLCGNDITVADCALFPFLWRIDQEFGPLTKEDGLGNLRSWLDTCGNVKSFKKTVQGAWWWWW